MMLLWSVSVCPVITGESEIACVKVTVTCFCVKVTVTRFFPAECPDSILYETVLVQAQQAARGVTETVNILPHVSFGK